MSRVHDLSETERQALASAYRDRNGDIGAASDNKDAWATLEALCRKGLLHFHRVVHQTVLERRIYVYRLTREGRLELYPETT